MFGWMARGRRDRGGVGVGRSGAVGTGASSKNNKRAKSSCTLKAQQVLPLSEPAPHHQHFYLGQSC